MLTRLGKHLADDSPVHPQTLLETVAADGPLTRALEDFLTASKLALRSDHDERRVAARRQSRIDAVAEPLRPAVARFASTWSPAAIVPAAPAPTRAGTPPSRPGSPQCVTSRSS
jgi:hypothetical protein